MDLTHLQIEIARTTLLMIALGTLSTFIWLWIMYSLLKGAIKNGINESDLVERRRLPPPQTPVAPAGYRWVLVKDDKPSTDIRPER